MILCQCGRSTRTVCVSHSFCMWEIAVNEIKEIHSQTTETGSNKAVYSKKAAAACVYLFTYGTEYAVTS